MGTYLTWTSMVVIMLSVVGWCWHVGQADEIAVAAPENVDDAIAPSILEEMERLRAELRDADLAVPEVPEVGMTRGAVTELLGEPLGYEREGNLWNYVHVAVMFDDNTVVGVIERQVRMVRPSLAVAPSTNQGRVPSSTAGSRRDSSTRRRTTWLGSGSSTPLRGSSTGQRRHRASRRTDRRSVVSTNRIQVMMNTPWLNPRRGLTQAERLRAQRNTSRQGYSHFGVRRPDGTYFDRRFHRQPTRSALRDSISSRFRQLDRGELRAR